MYLKATAAGKDGEEKKSWVGHEDRENSQREFLIARAGETRDKLKNTAFPRKENLPKA